MTGANVGHYKVLGHLGSGGMSDVYLAEDLRLGRQVALKFLPPLLEKNPASLERLRREARLTSALNHPHICTIHDIDEHVGQTFLVMERLEGTTLKRLVDTNGALPLDRALRLGAQIADALAAAHAHGIVHRDVKPGNIFVTPRDDAKVTDFGLAKQMPLMAGSEDSTVSPGPADTITLTAPGEAVGTIAYMSPEQARGEDVDARSDLFSFGAVLYEMITGRRAFSGAVPAVVFDQILNGTPMPARALLPGLPDDVSAILDRALEKNPEQRYQSGNDLRHDLIAARQSMLAMPFKASVLDKTPVLSPLVDYSRPRQARGPVETLPRQRRWIWGAAAGLLAIATGAAAAWLMQLETVAPLTERDSVILGTFSNATGDQVFDGTLREALAVHLGQSPFLNVLPAERLEETLRLMGRPEGSPLDHDAAREACERLNAKALIEGAIRPLGEHFVLSVSATGCASGETLVIGQNEVSRKEDVLRAVGEAAQSLRAQLGESLSMVESFGVPIEQATTPSLDALKAYTLGQARRAQGGEIESVPFFQRAVEIDPHFAMAWYALSLVYGNLGETIKGGEFGIRAYAERGRVSERERLAITYQYHDRVTGQVSETITTLELWKRLYPRDYRPANSLAVVFLRLGNYERAAQEAREALNRVADLGLPYSNLAYALRGLNRYDEATRVAADAVARRIETLPTRRLLYQMALMRGDATAAGEQLAWAENRPRMFDFVGARAQALAYQGQWREARALYMRTVDMARTDGLSEVAGAYAAQAAWTAELLGISGEMAAQTRELSRQSPQLELLALAALPPASDETALHRIDAVAARLPTDTLLLNVSAPIARASVHLAQRRPAQALEALRVTIPYDYGRVAALASIHLRAEAMRQSGDPRSATAEFTRLLAHRGTEPLAIFHAMAPLGLARAHAQAGDTAAALRAFDQFLGGFEHADPGLPVVEQARAEREALARQTP